MKSFIIIFVLIVSTECGLLDDLVISKDQKPKSSKEKNQGALIKVRQTLENGTKIVIDALGNIIKNPPKENDENTDSRGTLDTPTKDKEVAKNIEASTPGVAKVGQPNNSTDKVEVEAPKIDDNQNKTLPTESIAETKDAADNVKNATDTPKIDDNTDENCTDKACDNVELDNRAALNGDGCPSGKDRADDGTCVDEV